MKDLTPYNQFEGKLVPNKTILSVGWLSREYDYPRGFVAPEVVSKLANLILTHRTRQSRGFHYCEYCKKEDIEVTALGRRTILGSAEMWIYGCDSSIIFAAPNLIHHYIAAHDYLPPSAFLEAVKIADASQILSDDRWSSLFEFDSER